MTRGRQGQGRFVWLLIVLVCACGAGASEELLRCGSALRMAPASGQQRLPRYAPERLADITHVTIDVTPDFGTRTVQGVTTISFTPLVKPLTELRLDAIDLNVASVESSASMAGYTTTDSSITITFRPPVPAGEPARVAIRYDAEPQEGMYFRTPGMGYPEGDIHLFTQGESHEAPHWYPNFDYPNERFCSEVICRVPPEMTVLSNGRLVSEEIDPAAGLKAVHWLQDKPHVNYLVALVAGRFEKVEARYRDIPLAFYTPSSQIGQAANSFAGTADMIAFFEQELGVPYPWQKYDQVVVQDFVAGGMENTSLTILTDRTLFTEATENIRTSRDLVAHELVHQWMGDLVTCKDWSHLWLNEGFAVYYETLYTGHDSGRDAMLYDLYTAARSITSRADDKPVVYRHYEDAGEQFDYRAYAKGGWIVRMLRCRLGDELFLRVIRTYLERHALGIVVTEDLRAVVEELSGRSFDRFFDQWLYHGGCPRLDVAYEWSEQDKLAKITVKQTQAIGEAGPFHLPAKVRFLLGERAIDREILIDETQHDFYFALDAEPNIVRFDPELTLLAKVTLGVPRAMLYAQLENRSDVVGRLLAIDGLKEKKDKKTVARLKESLNNDPFYGVRREAASALREIHTDEAFEALRTSVDQNDARVRLHVVQELGSFYRSEIPACMEEVLAKEKNPAIQMAAIESLGCVRTAQTQRVLCEYLRCTSYRNELAGAALNAIRRLEDPAFVPELMAVLSERERQFASWDFARGLGALARCACRQEDRGQVRDFLAGYVNHPKLIVRSAALSALGTLGDPQALPIVEAFCGQEPHDRIQRQAKQALDKLRETKPPVPEEIVELRKMVDELKSQVEKLTKEVEDVRKQGQAKAEVTTDAGADSAADTQGEQP